ncbi:MAG: cyclic nucleotide-binding domain-containing protein, partial [Vicinamibacterales bacterium]|nr:cyclic nucleotide-binding domain-containing protein [Vicinamibacterales bacterium]
MASNSVFVGTSRGSARLLPGSAAVVRHWLDEVSEEAIAYLTTRWVVKTVAAGTTLMRANSASLGVCFVLKGTVRVQVAIDSSTPVTLALVGAGEIVGEMALLDGSGCVAEV